MMQGTQVGHLTDIRKVFVDPVMDNATRAIEEKAVESQAAFVKYLDPVACVTERAVVFCFLQCACNGTGNGNIVDYDEAMLHRTVPDAPPDLPDLCDGTGIGERKGPQMQFDACKQNRALSLLVLRVQRRAYASSLLPHPPCLYVVSGWGG